MAVVRHDINLVGTRRRGRPAKYPWEEWTNGSVWEIVQGQDYDVSTENMRVNLHLRAGKEDKKVITRLAREPGPEKLLFQFVPKTEL
jgi:hypothetical protein